MNYCTVCQRETLFKVHQETAICTICHNETIDLSELNYLGEIDQIGLHQLKEGASRYGSLRHKKEKIFETDQTCYLCRRPIEDIEHATLEHIIPKALGGRNATSNLKLAHQLCNNKKSDSPLSWVILGEDGEIEIIPKFDWLLIRALLFGKNLSVKRNALKKIREWLQTIRILR